MGRLHAELQVGDWMEVGGKTIRVLSARHGAVRLLIEGSPDVPVYWPTGAAKRVPFEPVADPDIDPGQLQIPGLPPPDDADVTPY